MQTCYQRLEKQTDSLPEQLSTDSADNNLGYVYAVCAGVSTQLFHQGFCCQICVGELSELSASAEPVLLCLKKVDCCDGC